MQSFPRFTLRSFITLKIFPSLFVVTLLKFLRTHIKVVIVVSFENLQQDL